MLTKKPSLCGVSLKLQGRENSKKNMQKNKKMCVSKKRM